MLHSWARYEKLGGAVPSNALSRVRSHFPYVDDGTDPHSETSGVLDIPQTTDTGQRPSVIFVYMSVAPTFVERPQILIGSINKPHSNGIGDCRSYATLAVTA
jgi:hypothetical protein